MKSTPLLFIAPMARASLDDSKTQTRRIVKMALPEKFWIEAQGDGFMVCADGEPTCYGGVWETHEYAYQKPIACPYGQPCDQLLVRETFFAWGRWETRFSAKKGRDEWHFVDLTLDIGRQYLYAAENDNYAANLGAGKGRGVYPGWWKRPSIFMPLAASRITLEITNVRVERLQDISEADAGEEGCGFLLPTYPQWDGDPDMYRKLYRVLWEQINGPGSWDANPWVWVVEFRRVRP